VISGRIADMDLAWIPIRIQDGSGSWRRLRCVSYWIRDSPDSWRCPKDMCANLA